MLDSAMETDEEGSAARFTPSDIKKLQTDLFGMQHFGDSLKTIFDNIEGAKGKRYIYKQIRVPVPLSTRVGSFLMGGLRRLTRSGARDLTVTEGV